MFNSEPGKVLPFTRSLASRLPGPDLLKGAEEVEEERRR